MAVLGAFATFSSYSRHCGRRLAGELKENNIDLPSRTLISGHMTNFPSCQRRLASRSEMAAAEGRNGFDWIPAFAGMTQETNQAVAFVGVKMA
jgi:hypothetical protein